MGDGEPELDHESLPEVLAEAPRERVALGETDKVELADEDVEGVTELVPVPLCVGVGVEVGLEVGLWEPVAEAETVLVVEGVSDVLPVLEALAP